MRRILVATDGSEPATRAVDFAARLAERDGAELRIVHIVGEYEALAEGVGDFSRQERLAPGEVLCAWSERTLAAARDRALRLGVPDIQLVSRIGDPATLILDTAQRDRAEAIVIGKRGLGQFSGLLLGSVSQKVVCVASCVVMVVP